MLYKTIDIVKNLILDTVVLLLLSPDNNNLTTEAHRSVNAAGLGVEIGRGLRAGSKL